MTRRVIVTLHLPLDMGAVGRILKAVASEYPDATVGENFQITADDGPLSRSHRRTIAHARRMASRPGSVVADVEKRP